MEKQDDYESWVVDLFDPDIIGHQEDKLSLILATIGGVDIYHESGNSEGTLKFRGKMNVCEIGPTSEAKTMMLKVCYSIKAQ